LIQRRLARRGFFAFREENSLRAVCRSARTFLLIAGLVLSLGSRVQAQDDDGLGDDQPQPAQNNALAVNAFEMNENQFEQWVFNGSRNAQDGMKRIESQLNMRLDSLDLLCDLTDSQKQQLRLAAKGDLDRFNDDYEKAHRKFMAVRKDRNAINNIWQDIQPLQQRLNTGLYGSDSLYAKSIRRVLSPEQREKYDEVERQRRQYRFEALIGYEVGVLERRMPLTNEQRTKLIELIIAESTAPQSSSRYDRYVVWCLASRIPEEKFKPLFDDVQWKVFEAQLKQGKAYEQMLIREKVIK